MSTTCCGVVNYRQVSNISRTKFADRRCSNYIWVIDNFIAYLVASYIRGFTVCEIELSLKTVDFAVNSYVPLVPHICVSESGQHWFRQWLLAYSVPTHYLNQCSLIVHRTLRNKLQWNLNQNSKIFIEENAFESVVCEMVAILFRGRWVNHWLGHWSTAPHPVLLHMVFFSMSVLADPEKDQAYPIKYKFRPPIDNSLITPFRKILPPHSKWRLPCWWPHRNLLTHKFTYCKICLF